MGILFGAINTYFNGFQEAQGEFTGKGRLGSRGCQKTQKNNNKEGEENRERKGELIITREEGEKVMTRSMFHLSKIKRKEGKVTGLVSWG